MSFNLKNVGATYQHAMTYIFHDYMHDIMEDYVDDLLVESYSQEKHGEALIKALDRLLEYKVRLNAKKYFFGVTSGKLLGFIVSRHDIEIDPNKFKVVVDMPPPTTLKQLQSLQGRLQAIRRFIA